MREEAKEDDYVEEARFPETRRTAWGENAGAALGWRSLPRREDSGKYLRYFLVRRTWYADRREIYFSCIRGRENHRWKCHIFNFQDTSSTVDGKKGSGRENGGAAR